MKLISLDIDTMAWFKHIPLKGSTRKRANRVIAEQKYYYNTKEYPHAGKRIPPLSTKWRIDINGKKAVLDGYKTKLYGINDLANIYDLNYSTVRDWWKKGILPEPFMQHKMFGNNVGPYWTKEQIRAICRVIDDIFSQGIYRIRVDYQEHIAMMQEGARYAIKSMDYDNKVNIEGESIRKRRFRIGGKYGIVWMND